MALRYLTLGFPSYSSDTYEQDTGKYWFQPTESVEGKSFASLTRRFVDTLLFFYNAP